MGRPALFGVPPGDAVAPRGLGRQGDLRPAPRRDEKETEGHPLLSEGADVGQIAVDVADDEGIADDPHSAADLPVEEGGVVDGHAKRVLKVRRPGAEDDHVLVARGFLHVGKQVGVLVDPFELGEELLAVYLERAFEEGCQRILALRRVLGRGVLLHPLLKLAHHPEDVLRVLHPRHGGQYLSHRPVIPSVVHSHLRWTSF